MVKAAYLLLDMPSETKNYLVAKQLLQLIKNDYWIENASEMDAKKKNN